MKKIKTLLPIVIIVVGVIFFLYQVKGETGNATFAAITGLMGLVALLIYQFNKYHLLYLRDKNNLRRVIVDLWLHTNRYDNDLVTKEEATKGERLTLFDRIKLFIKHGREEDVCFDLALHGKCLKLDYVCMEDDELENLLKQMEEEMEDINAIERHEMLEACYGSSTERSEEEEIEILKESIKRDARAVELWKKYSLALKSYVGPKLI